MYVDSKGRSNVTQIYYIENMFTSKDGVQNMYANQVITRNVLWNLLNEIDYFVYVLCLSLLDWQGIYFVWYSFV